MPSLLIELYDTHAIEKNVYQAFISNCDEILFLSLRKISEEERLSLRHFILEQVPNIKKVHFREFNLEHVWKELDLFIGKFSSVTINVFGGDSLLAIILFQYGLEKQFQIVSMDVEKGKQYTWDKQKWKTNHLTIPSLSIEQLIALRGGKLLKSRRPQHKAEQNEAIKKLAQVFIKRFEIDNDVESALGEYFKDFLKSAPNFYFGENNRGWKADFEYILRETTLDKVLEGNW